MKVLVCGDRNWTDYRAIERELKSLSPSVVIEGGQRGADRLANQAAFRLGIPVLPYRANWTKYGRAAGPIRNRQMLNECKPDLVLAFHPDLRKSKGTADMIAQARKAGIQVRIIEK